MNLASHVRKAHATDKACYEAETGRLDEERNAVRGERPVIQMARDLIARIVQKPTQNRALACQ